LKKPVEAVPTREPVEIEIENKDDEPPPEVAVQDWRAWIRSISPFGESFVEVLEGPAFQYSNFNTEQVQQILSGTTVSEFMECQARQPQVVQVGQGPVRMLLATASNKSFLQLPRQRFTIKPLFAIKNNIVQPYIGGFGKVVVDTGATDPNIDVILIPRQIIKFGLQPTPNVVETDLADGKHIWVLCGILEFTLKISDTKTKSAPLNVYTSKSQWDSTHEALETELKSRVFDPASMSEVVVQHYQALGDNIRKVSMFDADYDKVALISLAGAAKLDLTIDTANRRVWFVHRGKG